MKTIISVKNVSKIYNLGGEKIAALDDVSLDIKEGEFVSIVGPSGSGKSTLMHMIGLLDNPTSGTISVEGKDVTKLKEEELAKLRNKYIGFVFQQFNLLAKTTALENVQLPMEYGKVSTKDRKRKATELLKLLGLEDRILHMPNQLSGGQQQRVAIARSLAMDPVLILADEPTGNLDSKTGKDILELFHKLNKEGRTIVLVTHDQNIAAQAKRIVKIKDGKIEN